MAGRGRISDGCASAMAEADARIAVWGRDGSWKFPARHPLHDDKPEKVGVGPGLAFARGIVDFFPAGEQQIGLVPCAVGGSEIARWTAPDGDLFTSAVERVRQAQCAGGVLKGILWHQGESDAGSEEDAAQYADRLRATIRNLRVECGAPDVPVVLGELGMSFLDMVNDSRFRFAERVNDAIVEVGLSSGPHVAVASAFGLGHNGDRLHFSAAAADELGRRYAWKWLRITGLGEGVSLHTLVEYTLEPPLLRDASGQEKPDRAVARNASSAVLD